jgi:hypothetical protein
VGSKQPVPKVTSEHHPARVFNVKISKKKKKNHPGLLFLRGGLFFVEMFTGN